MTASHKDLIRLGEVAKRNKRFITTVVDVEVENRRDEIFARLANAQGGRRGQPFMVDRLRALTVYIEWLLAGGCDVATNGELKKIDFGVGPNSQMNKIARNWLNGRYAGSTDERKSRSPDKELKPDSVRHALRQVRQLRERST